MEKNINIQDFPSNILNAPKTKFKKPTLKPTPLFLSESPYSMEYLDSDNEEDFSSEEGENEKTLTKNIKANSLFIKYTTVVKN